QGADAGDHLRSMRARRRAVADAPGDALQNAGEAECVVREIPIERRNAVAVGLLAIEGDSLVERWNVERLQIEPAKARTASMRHHPIHQVVSEISERIAER